MFKNQFFLKIKIFLLIFFQKGCIIQVTLFEYNVTFIYNKATEVALGGFVAS